MTKAFGGISFWLLGVSLLIVAPYYAMGVVAWSPKPSFSLFGSLIHNNRNHQCQVLHSTFPPGEENTENVSAVNEKKNQRVFAARRAFLGAAAMNIGLLGAGAAVIPPSAVWAADSADSSARTIFKSGKAPIVPGGKPKDKSDVKGTRKDPDFLRSIADCRSQCQNTAGSDGYARSKEDCLSECQDICCKTYEQCTFDIVPRI